MFFRLQSSHIYVNLVIFNLLRNFSSKLLTSIMLQKGENKYKKDATWLLLYASGVIEYDFTGLGVTN